MSDDYDAAVTASMHGEAAQSARIGFSAASDTNPDAYAEAQRVARRTGVPVDTALAMPQEVKRQDAIGSIDFSAMAKTSPATAALLADVEKARIAHDDVDNLTGIEAAIYAFGKFEVGTAKAIASSVPKMNEGLWGVARAGADQLPDFAGKPMAAKFAQWGGMQRDLADSMMPKSDSLLGNSWYSGMQSLGSNALLLPVAVASGGAAPMLWGMGASTGGQAYGEARDAGRSPNDALAFGASQGVIEAGTEMIGLPALLSTLKPGKFLTKAAEYLIKEQGGEQIATHLQDLNEWAVLHPEKSVGDYLAARPDAALQTALSTLFSGGGQLAVVKGIGLMTEQKGQQAEQAPKLAELLTGMNKLAEASMVRGRDAETAQGFFQSALAEGRDAVYITPDALAQSGLAEKMALTIPAVQEQLQTAAESGHDIRIPLADLMTQMAGPELEQALIPHLSYDAGGFTATTAQAYLQSGQAQELHAEVERVLGEKEGDDSFKASAESVKGKIQADLDLANRFTPAVNDAYATLHKNFYAVTAARMGITPEAMYEQYPLRIGAEAMGGQQLDQGGNLITETPNFKNWFGESKVVGADGSPLRVFHGAPDIRFVAEDGVFTTMRDRALKYGFTKESKKGAESTRAFFFTTSQGVAKTYANPHRAFDYQAAEEGVIPAYISINSPLVFDAKGAHWREAQKQISKDDFIGKAKEEGHDGVIIKNVRDSYDSMTTGRDPVSDVYVAFNSNQIKHAISNNGNFDPNDPNILHQGARGSFNPATLSITLLKSADLSTFLHESGHFFLEVQASIADQIQQAAAIHGADTLTAGEREILSDSQAVFDWFGVKNLAEWNGLDFEEKRSYHEKFARGFESYLFEGKAPSIELQGVFQRFRAWMLNVYRDLKNLNVEITPEVRGVFDRMLATTEQIQLAEQGRSMMPLFESAEKAGMTLAEFAEYQALGTDATNEAIETLQARGLRDMQWIHNARGRVIKQLQKESAARRAEVQMGVRSEVMSQPVYRAWSFLTGKIGRDDMLDGEKARADHQASLKAWENKRTAFETETRKDAKQTVWAASDEGQKRYQKAGTLAKAQAKVLRREEKAIDAITEKALAEWDKSNHKPADPNASAKSDPNSVDESRDTLFMAIAKLGGITKTELISTWGIDPADKAASGVFGKHVMRAADQGLSIDGMAEQLSQYGYLHLDENGKWDLAEFEQKFKSEMSGDAQYSTAFDYAGQQQQDAAGRDLANPAALNAGRLDRASLAAMGLPAEVVARLDALKMAKTGALHPDVIAELFGFSSGDELVRSLAAAQKPADVIAGMTDQRMLEQYGDLSSEQAIETAADQAIHNDVRARLVTTELNALSRATGAPKVLASAARDYASALIARIKVRNILPGQYTSAEARAAKAAQKASKSGDLAAAATEKRNQLINLYAAKAAYAAQDEVKAAVKYFKKFDVATTRAKLPADYLAQIDVLLDRYDMRAKSNIAVDRTKSLRTWVQSRLNAGEIPNISESLLTPQERQAYSAQTNSRDDEGNLVYPDDDERIKLLADAIDRSAKRSIKDLTVEEVRGLRETVQQIEHLGRLKDKMLTAMEGAGYAATRDLLASTVIAHAKDQGKNTRTDNTWLGAKLDGLRQFGASHIKPAIWMRIFDGGQDNGPWWSTVVRPANERATFETTRRAAATSALMDILAPVLKNVSYVDQIGKGKFFPTIGTSLNWEERMAFAFNYGNESNLQRLMGGGIAGVTKALNMGQIHSVLGTLSAAEWQAVQGVWDHFETYRPEIGAKEMRVNGVEPAWIAARPFAVKTSDGQTINLRGGYFPVKFDSKTSLKAQQHGDAQAAKDAMKAAYSAATTQRSFTKDRVEEVTGRPLLLNLSGLYSGVNDVIHDLAWHEWVIDVNRLLRSESIDGAIREHYGANVKGELTKWRDDIVAGSARLDHGIENAAGWARKFVSSAALTYNVISALMQPLGITQSFSRVGAKWVGMGLGQYLSGPVAATRMVKGKSEYMTNRTRTMFRDVNELRNRVNGQTLPRELMGRYGYYLTMQMQMTVDVPTWIGAYEKALAGGHADDVAIALADQSVKDSQGGGEEVDQSGITRGGPMVKLFTAFYDFMNTQANVLYLKNATAESRADAFMHMATVGLVTPFLAAALRDALIPGDSGDWDDWDKVLKKLLTEGLGNLIGMMAFGREFTQAAKTLIGEDKGITYSGPVGLRIIPDVGKLAAQVHQWEFDDAFRKALINAIGDVSGIPAVQLNRAITGYHAISEGKTTNPAALAFGFQEKH